MSDALISWENATHRLQILPDNDPVNPRDDDNLWTLIAWHSRYALGDVAVQRAQFPHPDTFLADLYAYVTNTAVPTDAEGDPLIDLAQWAANTVALRRLYLYDHTILDLSSAPFAGRAPHAAWDSGTVGYAFVTQARMAQEYGDHADAIRQAEQLLDAELRVYTDYLNGRVYGYLYQRKSLCDHGAIHFTTDNECWGFYGEDYRHNGMSDSWTPAMQALAQDPHQTIG